MWSNTIEGTIKPIWVLSRIFGTCPRSMRQKMYPHNKRTYGLIAGIYSLTAIAVAIYLAYSTSNFNILKDINIVTQLADILFTFTNNMSMMATIFFCCLHQKKFTSLLYKLQCIEKKLKVLFTWKSYRTVKIFISCELFYILGTWTLFFIYYVVLECEGSTLRCLGAWFSIYSSTKISQVLLIQFCSYVMVLRHTLIVINDNIKVFLEKHNEIATPTHKITFNQIEKIYDDILRASTELQFIFSIPLLMKIANIFVCIFSSCYFSVFGFPYNGRHIKPKKFVDILIPLYIILISVMELLAAVIICESTTSELKKTAKWIYRAPMTRSNIPLMKRVNLFALHLVHKDFEFTASGFFKINGSLLQTIIGAVTVYLVMFIQFDLATNKGRD